MRRTWMMAAVALTLTGCDRMGLEPRFDGVPPIGLQPAFNPFKALAGDPDELERLRRGAEEQLRTLDREIQKLKDQTGRQADRAEGQFDQTIRDLENRREELERQLRASGKAGEELLRKIGQAVDEAVQDAKKAAK